MSVARSAAAAQLASYPGFFLSGGGGGGGGGGEEPGTHCMRNRHRQFTGDTSN